MNLAIDVGNTRLKLGVFDPQKLILTKSCNKEELSDSLDEISDAYPSVSNCIVSSVGLFSEAELVELHNRFDVLQLDHQTKVPFLNKYATPQTLGVDRIALVSAAALQYPENNVLIIDAGTCITYDFLSSENQYLGGAISPGIAMRYRSLNTFTNKLPLLSPINPNFIIGNSTANSIHSGIINGILFEMDGFIEAYQKKYSNLTVILTGGDTHFLRDSIKNDIFANSNFLLEGLNHILEYNKH
jgi:type III pantothenate kinase